MVQMKVDCFSIFFKSILELVYVEAGQCESKAAQPKSEWKYLNQP